MATDFNGVKLLDGSLSVTANQMKIHFGTGNNSAEDYYCINVNAATMAFTSDWFFNSGVSAAR